MSQLIPPNIHPRTLEILKRDYQKVWEDLDAQNHEPSHLALALRQKSREGVIPGWLAELASLEWADYFVESLGQEGMIQYVRSGWDILGDMKDEPSLIAIFLRDGKVHHLKLKAEWALVLDFLEQDSQAAESLIFQEQFERAFPAKNWSTVIDEMTELGLIKKPSSRELGFKR